MKEIRVLRIITRLNIGGPSVHVAYLSQFLNKTSSHRFKTLLISGKTDEAEGSYRLFSNKNFQYVYLSSLQRQLHPWRDFKAFLQIAKIIIQFRPHIVHTHQAKAGFLGRLAALVFQVPIVIHTFHGHTFHSYFSAWKTRFFLFLERILSRKCHLIVISPHQKKEIETYLNNPPSLSLIPLGLPLKSLSQTPLTLTLRKELNIEKSALLIGWVGRLAPIKNIFMFLNVAKTVHSLHKEVHFIIIGDGNMRAQVQEWIDREGLQQKIHILGFRSDLPNIYHSLDIVTLTSLNEGTPVSLLEACACSKPVVATRVGGIEDIISHGETGYLANGDDEESFSNSLLKLIQNPSKRHQMGRNGQKRTLQHYDINRLLQDLHTYYDNLLLRTDSQTSTIF